jgi:hypothetical protein
MNGAMASLAWASRSAGAGGACGGGESWGGECGESRSINGAIDEMLRTPDGDISTYDTPPAGSLVLLSDEGF